MIPAHPLVQVKAGGGSSDPEPMTITSYASDEANDVQLLAAETSQGWNNDSSADTITMRLPATPGLPAGTRYRFAVTAAQNVVVQANTNQIIRVGASASTAGGAMTSNTIGSVLEIVYERANTWTGISSGTWTAS